MLTAEERHSALIEAMVADGTLVDPALVEAFRAVPRHRFIPETGALTAHGTALDATGNHELWLSAVYADDAIVTRMDEAEPPGGREELFGEDLPVARRYRAPQPRRAQRHRPASSSTAPTVLARMLELAGLRRGRRVLEIGTGTGWNTALLSHRVGSRSVISVEIDEHLARAAVQTLRAEGYEPAVHTADGYEGFAPEAPYDRIITACGVRRLPPSWLEQLEPDGRVVFPWGLLEGAGVLARATRLDDGSMCADFHGGVGFVPLRVPGPPLPPVRDSGQQPDEYRLTQTDPVAPLMAFPSAFALSVMVPDWRVRRRWIGTGSGLWVCDRTRESWVRIYPYGTSWMVEQGGPRSIWDEFEEALEEWRGLGSPEPDRFGLSVDPDGAHRVWLDSPEGRTWRC